MKNQTKVIALSVAVTVVMIATVVFCNWLGAHALNFFTGTLDLQENIVHALGITSAVIQSIASVLASKGNTKLQFSVLLTSGVVVTTCVFSVGFAALCLPFILGIAIIPYSMKHLKKTVDALN